MNTETHTPQAAALPPPPGARDVMLTLVRREFWEHTSLWLVPAIGAAVLALLALGASQATINVDLAHLPRISADDRAMITNVSQDAFLGIVYLVASVVVSFYALDCLYSERKDRSILFWKSLPVSDGMTVLSKFLVATVAVPFGALLLATASHLIALTAWNTRAHFGGFPPLGFDLTAWLRGEVFLVLIVLLASLWYAPVIAASMLLSAWVKRSPVMWATVGVLGLLLADAIVFHTGWVSSVIRYRSNGIWRVLFANNDMNEHTHLLDTLHWGAAFGHPNLWLGVVAAGAMLYLAARVRRYRDDT